MMTIQRRLPSKICKLPKRRVSLKHFVCGKTSMIQKFASHGPKRNYTKRLIPKLRVAPFWESPRKRCHNSVFLCPFWKLKEFILLFGPLRLWRDWAQLQAAILVWFVMMGWSNSCRSKMRQCILKKSLRSFISSTAFLRSCVFVDKSKTPECERQWNKHANGRGVPVVLITKMIEKISLWECQGQYTFDVVPGTPKLPGETASGIILGHILSAKVGKTIHQPSCHLDGNYLFSQAALDVVLQSVGPMDICTFKHWRFFMLGAV